jgi:hypothetical protein
MKPVGQPQQMMLKDLIDKMHVVEDTNEDLCVLLQSFEILAGNIIEAAVGPLFVVNELRMRLTTSHLANVIHVLLLLPIRAKHSR